MILYVSVNGVLAKPLNPVNDNSPCAVLRSAGRTYGRGEQDLGLARRGEWNSVHRAI
jgi:hypothetical protein